MREAELSWDDHDWSLGEAMIDLQVPPTPEPDPRLVEEAAALSASYLAFLRPAWSAIDPAPLRVSYEVEAMAAALEAWARGEFKRLMIHIRPRRGKTKIGSVLLNGWIWTWRPTSRVLWSSFSDDRCTEDARLTRMLVTSRWYQERWPLALAADQSVKNRFALATGGYRYTAIWGSAATGDGGDYLGADDAQCAADMHKPIELRRDHEWNYTTWERRRNPPEDDVPMVQICQRLGAFDLANQLRMDAPNDYEVLAIQTRKTIVDMAPYYRMNPDGSVSTTYLPLITDGVKAVVPPDPREPGELLEGLKEEETRLLEESQPEVNAAQNQQSPVLRAAGLVKLYRFADSNVIDFAEEMGAPDLRAAVRKALQVGWYGLLGADHGLDARREVCHALLVEPTRRQIRLVGSYVNQRRTGVEADAEGIAAMLDTIGLPVAFIRLAVGDVGSTGKRDETPQSINAVLGKILGLTIHLPDKTAGSIDRGVEALNSLLGSGALRFDRSCGAAIACAQNWTGAETWKDGVDAFRYPVYQVAREWLHGGLVMQSV